jgi:preprotein translocase subunit SecE
MATSDDNDEKKTDAEENGEGEDSSSEALVKASDDEVQAAEGEGAEGAPAELAAPGEGDDAVEAAAFGSEKYVHAAFFAAGILAAYLASKIFVMGWNNLAAWPAAVRAVPQLISYAEEQRDSIGLVAGATIGTLTVVQSYRKESVRTWANEVAAELSKVTWPTREAVLNGTIVVVVASALGTLYIAVLDKIWGFLTNLVYGA